MSVLVGRSLLVLALLFGLVFAVGTAVIWYLEVPLWGAIVFAVLVVGLQYLLGPSIIGWIFKIRWISAADVSAEFASFLDDTCRRDGIPVPRLGIIEDGNPNAFTYGHYPGNARLVVTWGLVEMLTSEELNAVVGHELGHIKHWDFVVMTLASLVPLILYYCYLFSRYQARGRGRSAQAALVIAIVSYIAYIISQYVALFLSRVREYYADYYGARTTRDPNALATALVKIAYGLARAEPVKQTGDDNDKRPVLDRTKAIASLSFFGVQGANHFAISALGPSGTFSPDTMRRAMRWDLSNPWARWFELNMTHPLAAKRIREVEKYAGPAHQEATFQFADAAPSYWDKFIVDMFMAALPYIGGIAGLYLGWLRMGGQMTMAVNGIGMAVLFFGLGMLLKTMFMYKSTDFRPTDVMSLVQETDVSHIRPIPAELKGKIIGRGVPGLVWSSDLVIQDDHGFITLLYRQPLGFLEFLFGWLKAESFIGREVVVRGWYRRGPGPYLEMRDAAFDNGEAVRCWYYHFILGVSVVISLVGAAMVFLL